MTTETQPTNGETALAFITAAHTRGATVHISSMTRIIAVTPKAAARWAKSGHPLFKVTGGDLYMAQGRGFVKLTAGAVTLVGLSAQ